MYNGSEITHTIESPTRVGRVFLFNSGKYVVVLDDRPRRRLNKAILSPPCPPVLPMVIVVVDAVWELFMKNDVHKQAESSATKFEVFEECDIQESISMSVMENGDPVLKRRDQDLGRFFWNTHHSGGCNRPSVLLFLDLVEQCVVERHLF